MNAKDIEILKSENMNLADKIYIFDTTLRDGEQTPGVALTVDEKIQIAQKLNNLGVDKIEVGFPASSKGETESAKRIKSMDLDSTLVGLARSLKGDIDAVLDADLEYIHTFIGTSPLHRDYKLKMSKEKIIEKAIDSVEFIYGAETFPVKANEEIYKPAMLATKGQRADGQPGQYDIAEELILLADITEDSQRPTALAGFIDEMEMSSLLNLPQKEAAHTEWSRLLFL